MSGNHVFWSHRLTPALRRRVEIAEAVAIEAQYRVHTEQALDLVAALAPRTPFDEAIDRYLEIMDLRDEHAETVRVHALASLAEHAGPANLELDLPDDAAPAEHHIEWKYATPLGAVRFVRRHMRRSAEEDLWTELVVARSEEALILEHVHHAVALIELLDDHVPPTQVLHHFLARLAVPGLRAHSVYQRTLARIADLQLPRTTARVAAD
jgi:hypothetical protein